MNFALHTPVSHSPLRFNQPKEVYDRDISKRTRGKERAEAMNRSYKVTETGVVPLTNLDAVRRYASQHEILYIALKHANEYFAKQDQNCGCEMQVVFKNTRGELVTYVTTFASYKFCKQMISRWRNAHGAPVIDLVAEEYNA